MESTLRLCSAVLEQTFTGRGTPLPYSVFYHYLCSNTAVAALKNKKEVVSGALPHRRSHACLMPVFSEISEFIVHRSSSESSDRLLCPEMRRKTLSSSEETFR